MGRIKYSFTEDGISLEKFFNQEKEERFRLAKQRTQKYVEELNAINIDAVVIFDFMPEPQQSILFCKLCILINGDELSRKKVHEIISDILIDGDSIL